MGCIRFAVAVVGAVATVSCVDRLAVAEQETGAVVLGRVEQVTALAAVGPGSPTDDPRRGEGDAVASTAEVGELSREGGFSVLALAPVQDDGAYRIEDVPAERDDLVVVARNDVGSAVGWAMLPERTRGGRETRVEPITGETTVEVLTWARLRLDPLGSETSPAEIALLIRADARTADTMLENDEIGAIAEAIATAGETLTRAYAASGSPLDAAARASLLAPAWAQLVDARLRGNAREEAAEAYLAAAMEAWASASAGSATVEATAAAASMLDEALRGPPVATRGRLSTEAVRLNLQARQALARRSVGSALGPVAEEILAVLEESVQRVRGAGSARDVRSALDAGGTRAGAATADDMADLLVPARGDEYDRWHTVLHRARDATAAARLSSRLSSTASARAAAAVLGDYRADVRAAVEALLEACGCPGRGFDAESMTSLYVAAHGDAHIRD